jgi:hypothetical protein
MIKLLITFVLSLLFAFGSYELVKKEIIRKYFTKKKICERHIFEFLKRWIVYSTLATIYIIWAGTVIEKFYTIKVDDKIQNVKSFAIDPHLFFYSVLVFALIIVCVARIQVFNNSYSVRDFVEVNIFFGFFGFFWLVMTNQFTEKTLTNITDIIWRIYSSELAFIFVVFSFIATLATELIIWPSFSEED